MKLIGLMVARNEDWIIGFSLRAALKWVDHMVVLDHASTDGTREILQEISREEPGRLTVLEEKDPLAWDEMVHRQRTLDEGRRLGGTHFAIIDADEVITSNLLGQIRGMVEELKPGILLDLPMICPWKSVDRYRSDANFHWKAAMLSLAFADNRLLFWRSAADGYQHHNRIPAGIVNRVAPLKDRSAGGVMHFEWANWRRLRAKHYWYRMMEAVRWPGRRTAKELNKIYNLAMDETGVQTSACPPAWLLAWAPYLSQVKLDGVPWHEEECRRLWRANPPETFVGLEIPQDLIGAPERPFDGIVVPMPRIWFCESCGLIGAVSVPKGATDAFMYHRLSEHHRSSSPGCEGRGLRFVYPDNLSEDRILGRLGGAPPSP